LIIYFSKRLGVTSGLAFIVILLSTTQLVKASSGLKVDVFVNDAECVIGQTADITLSTTQDFKSVVLPASNGVVNFQFGEDEVPVGDSVFANVAQHGEIIGHGSIVNGREIAPERIDVNLNCGNRGDSASSSTSSSSTSRSSSSSSRERLLPQNSLSMLGAQSLL
jgi:hypothetical protein